MPTASTPAQPAQLKRVLGLPALIIYGIVLIQLTAPMPLFGAAAVTGKGHVVTAILIGMVAMLFTAISYGKMANAYPNAGAAMAFLPTIASHPEALCLNAAFIVLFTVLFTVMNLRGIEASARTNSFITVGLCVVIVLFLVAVVRYLFLNPPHGAGEFTRPFYDPQTFSFHDVSSGAALAVLTYIGFDGVSTLSEEAHNPRRNILLATVLVCLITGVLASVQVYFAQLIWPGTDFPDQDNAFSYVAGRAGGQWLFTTVNAALLVSSIGSGAGAHLGAGRLLYSMGRDNAIPRKFFGVINPSTRIPSNNIILIGVIMLVAALSLKTIQEFEHVDAYGFGCVLLNFGALFAFMGVNLSAFLHYFIRGERKTFWNCVSPLMGFAVCAYLWGSLGKWAIIVGVCWLSTGIIYGAWRTSFFQRPIQFAGVSDEPKAVAE